MLDLEYDPKPLYNGGSVQNADQDVLSTMRKMYDDGIEKLLHPELGYKNIKFDNSKDFACGMPISDVVSDTLHYKEKVYGFCSKTCKDEFLKNPNRYLTKRN
ncbi:hypothetical protein FNO01nite_33280 [Flavobacterium noncentrifugens]|uniref:YHS domain-containing protein n=1 Tax=Flavobacterium noncentrifugens TaxID=1128970 RepID=A0A1G8ZMX2_9FLAO|nr:YHS domain-containing protein [Flavobacterium noncentrifugens]GEP52656.1 hypothetical protein FNO01nite_33280 [Flavobacterium noncentrifugens]SDK15924.1 YHS domain-containing protein [Flavobacterium noncentrifugens]